MVLESDAMEESLQVLSKACWKRIVALRRKRNALIAPVHRLPVETLVTILQASAKTRTEPGWASFNSQQYSKNLHTIAQVCEHWSTVVVTTPHLWRHITSSSATKFSKTSLSKSGQLPLTVSVEGRTDDIKRLPAFAALVKPHSHRWESIYLSFHKTRSFLDFLSTPTPSLTRATLILIPQKGVPPAQPFNPFLTPIPALRDLYIQDLPISWDAVKLSGLTSLYLAGATITVTSPARILTLLRGSPQLRVLCFSCSKFHGAEVWRWTQAEEVVLTDLSDLAIKGLPTDSTRYILESLRAPNCRNVDIDCNLLRRDPKLNPLLASLQPFFVSALQSLTSPAPRLSITVRDGSFHFNMGAEGLDVSIYLRAVVGFKPLEWVGKVLQDHLPSMLVQLLLWEDVDTASAAFLPSLTGLHSLVGVEFDRTCPACLPFINLITSPMAVDGVQRWPFPHLDTFVFEPHDFTSREILEMVRSRHGVLHSGGEPLELPAPIKYLEYSTDSQADEKYIEAEIKEILGEGGLLEAYERLPLEEEETESEDDAPY